MFHPPEFRYRRDARELRGREPCLLYYDALMPRFLMGGLMLAFACLPAAGQKWVTTWAASVQGPYPVGNPSVQPNLRFAFPSPETGARDQTFRLIVHPDLWGTQTRLRFSNAFGTKPLTLDGVFAGTHLAAASVVARTNRAVRFGGKAAVTIPAGGSVWSDAVAIAAAAPGAKLAVSFHVAGESGPM